MAISYKSKHPMTFKIKDKKLLGRNCILDNFITRKFELQGSFFWITDPDPGDSKKDRIRPDSDPQHWYKPSLLRGFYTYRFFGHKKTLPGFSKAMFSVVNYI